MINNTYVQQASFGTSICNVYLRDVIPLTDDGRMVILAAKVIITAFESGNDAGGTSQVSHELGEIKKAFEDPEYKEATQILRSTISTY